MKRLRLTRLRPSYRPLRKRKKLKTKLSLTKLLLSKRLKMLPMPKRERKRRLLIRPESQNLKRKPS